MEIPTDARDWRWNEVLGLYLGVANGQLRYFDEAGQMVPTPAEAARWEQQRAEQERQRAERLAQRLRELGVEPD